MSRPTIAIDIDDVLFANAFRVVQTYNTKHSTNIHQPVVVEKGVIRKGTMQLLCEHTGLSEAEITAQVELLLSESAFHDIEPLARAGEVLARLSQNYRLVAISARPRVMTEQSMAWIDKHFSGLFDSVHIIGDRWGGGVLVNKTALLQQERAAYLIDDLPKNVLAANAAGLKGVLFGEYYWNELPASDGEQIIRCKDWQAVQDYFDGQGSR